MADTTEWFPASINPVRVGWYEVQSNPLLHWNHRYKLTGRPFRYWCGKQWKIASPSEALVLGLGPSVFGSHPSHQWRGLKSGGGQMSIPLPPLPRIPGTFAMSKFDEDNIDLIIRARDQEIVRCVLEAAAKMCRDVESGLWKIYKQGDGALKKGRGSEYVQGAADQSALLADAVVNLEFRHHE